MFSIEQCFNIDELCRLKLRRLLQESNLYRPRLLLGKIKDTELYAECAILHGKVVTDVDLACI